MVAHKDIGASGNGLAVVGHILHPATERHIARQNPLKFETGIVPLL